MIPPEPDSPAARVRSQAAVEWLVKRDRTLTAEEQDAFMQWLAADARHGEWFALHRRAVRDFACLAQWRPEHSEEPNPDLLARPPSRLFRLRPVLLAAAAAVALTIGLASWRSWPAAPEPAVARVGGYERQVLADGSTVELNRGAAITVAFTAQERRVTLVRGEARFTVAKNAQRPFVVRAGEVGVRAVGTAFNVRLGAAAIDVLVTEGRVQIDAAAGTGAAVSPPLVDAGQRAVVPRSNAAPPRIEPVAAEQMTRLVSWEPQLLDFSSVPLDRVLEEFNRRNRRQLRLADPALGRLPIVASIRSDNIDGLVHFLAINAGLSADERGNETVLRRD
jgi:transmembrane sensor